MSDTESRVLDETKRFLAVLPELIKQYRGRWVVFRDGQVTSDHATEDEAYSAAVARFGVTGGFVVAPVTEVEPTPVTAGVMFDVCAC